MATSLEVISGKKKGSLLYVHDDYVYYRDKRGDYIFRCNTRRTTRCRGALSVNKNNVEILETHNHAKSPFIMLQHQMKEKMLELSRETCMDLKEIFDSVCRSNPNAGQYLSFPSIRSSMHRERVKVRPSVPETLASLRDIIENSDIMKNIYQASVISNNDKIAIILSTTDLLEGLSSATEIYVDGTFSVFPRTPHIAQLYSVHIRYMDTGIATLFIMCDVRTTTFYDALWDKIKQLVPQLEQNVEFIMSDYEMAAIKSLSNKFPKAKLSGCWFHFNQAVLRKWRKLELSHAPQTILSMTMALPLLPADMFNEALLIIQAEADLLSREHPNVLQFMSYLRLTWSNMASKISTYDCPIRTNNIVESFHNIATQKLGTRNINVWTFLEKLKNLIADQELDLRRLKNGIQPRRTRTRTNRERNTKIINAQKSLIEKRLPLKQFLLMVNTRNDIFQIEELASFDDEALSYDVQVADRTFFADDFNVPIQTERTNIRRTYRRRKRISLPCPREKDNNSEANTDKDSEPEFNDNNVTASTQETIPTGQNETSETILNISTLENNLSNMQDVASIYEVPDDDYGYWYSDNSNASEELPFHTISWDLENSQNISREKPSEDICTLCFTNERTYIFVPCGHLVCCSECIERLERNRCPVCNTIFEKYLRVRKP